MDFPDKKVSSQARLPASEMFEVSERVRLRTKEHLASLELRDTHPSMPSANHMNGEMCLTWEQHQALGDAVSRLNPEVLAYVAKHLTPAQIRSLRDHLPDMDLAYLKTAIRFYSTRGGQTRIN